VEILGGQLKKKALHTIEFTLEMHALVYIMVFNLYPVKNLTTLSVPRTIFLFDLFTHKEIDICGHIYYLFIKNITKKNASLTLSFPNLVISLILRARVTIPSGLPIMQKEDPISKQTIIRSKAYILDQASVSLKFQEMMLQKKKETLMRNRAFHFSLGGTTQPSSQT